MKNRAKAAALPIDVANSARAPVTPPTTGPKAAVA